MKIINKICPILTSQYMGKKKAMDSHNPKGYQNERKFCPEDVTEKIILVTEGLIEVLQERMVCMYVYALVFVSGFWENMLISHIQICKVQVALSKIFYESRDNNAPRHPLLLSL